MLLEIVKGVGGSKTYVLLIFFALLGLVAVVIAGAFFGQELWHEFFQQLGIETGAGTVRAMTNDGVPKAVAAYKNGGNSPYSQITPPAVGDAGLYEATIPRLNSEMQREVPVESNPPTNVPGV